MQYTEIYGVQKETRVTLNFTKPSTPATSGRTVTLNRHSLPSPQVPKPRAVAVVSPFSPRRPPACPTRHGHPQRLPTRGGAGAPVTARHGVFFSSETKDGEGERARERVIWFQEHPTIWVSWRVRSLIRSSGRGPRVVHLGHPDGRMLRPWVTFVHQWFGWFDRC